MDLAEIGEREQMLRKHVKKNCLLCMGRSRLHTNLSDRNPEKAQVQSALKALHDVYQEKFDGLRARDAEGAQITDANTNKRFVLDLIDECRACPRETDLANRALVQLK